MVNIVAQRDWTEKKLQQDEPEKQIVMARPLLDRRVFPIMTPSGKTLIAQTGAMMCYLPGDHLRPTPDDYDHWPLQSEIFHQTYQAWDIWDWHPSTAERHLMQFGCKPYSRMR